MYDNKTTHGKVYVADKEDIKFSMIITLTIIATGIFTIYRVNGGFESLLSVAMSSSIAFIGIMCCFSVVHTNKVYIHDDYIGVQALYNPKEPKIYKWKDIYMCVIGNVEVKNTRLPYSVFGIQIFYTEKFTSSYDVSNVSSFQTYSLKHLFQYEELIRDIEEVCSKQGIKYIDQRQLQ